ncbi:MAG: sensor histidine kinase [Actinobacteria bacterium]|nr:sensor histidine kinase [Actinomycetota bacterium]
MAEAILAVTALVLAVATGVLWVRGQRRHERLALVEERAGEESRRSQARSDLDAAALRRLEGALDAIPHGVLVLDSTGATVFSNAVANAFESARHGDALVAAAVEEVMADAMQGHADTRAVELFGPPKRMLVITSNPLLHGEALTGAVVVIEDVSERRRVDDMRRDFVANISHELKTPVGAISLLAETLVAEDDIDVTQRLAGRIVNESARVSRTIDDLLELSRIESEEAPQFATVAATDVVADAMARIRPAAEQAGIPLEVVTVDASLAVEGDRRQITSAVSNLLDNAIKYSDSGQPVQVGASLQEGNARFWVRDHGIGIPARDIERIFERFYRVDQARSRRTGGTGLGLAIVRHVAHNHDGDVTVESRLGKGSTFSLCLPAASLCLPAATPLEAQSSPSSEPWAHPSSAGALGPSGEFGGEPFARDEPHRADETRKAG